MRAERLTSQGIAGAPFRSVETVAERVLAIQAQDSRGARLAVRVRSEGLTAADVDRALTEDRSLVVSWLNRGTLHLVRSEDYGWLHQLTTPRFAKANETRLGQEGVTPSQAERGAELITRLLAENGPMSRQELRRELEAADVPVAGQALIHLLMLATRRGLILRGPMRGREQLFVRVQDWLGPQPDVDRAAALAELARRYLAGHGPADERDLAKWSGLTLTDARAGLRTIAAELIELPGGAVQPRSRRPRPDLW